MTEECFLFVYGTLMKKCPKNQWSNFLQENAKYLGEGWTSGVLYQIDFYPGLIRGHEKVYGEIYQLNNALEIFFKLDTYEGYNSEKLDESLYLRKNTQVYSLIKCEYISAFTYFYNQSIVNLERIESGKFKCN